MRDSPTSADALSPEASVSAVWGANRTWLAAASIAALGVAGAGVALVTPGAGEWLRPWSGAAYGVAVAGLATLLPRGLAVVRLGHSLRHRPAAHDPARPWWPLVLLASALRDTPSIRRTPEDIRSAMARFVPQARSLLAQRLWPACTAAFVAPALGLVSSLISWKAYLPEAVRAAKELGQQQDLESAVPAIDWGAVAWPMVFAIALSLVLMVAAVVIDQMTRRLLLKWETAIRVSDADLQVLPGGPGGDGTPGPGPSKTETTPHGVPPTRTPPETPAPSVTADALQGLGDELRRR